MSNKAQITKDIQTLSTMFSRGEWEACADFVRSNPSVAVQRMRNTGLMPRTPFVVAAVVAQSAMLMRAFVEAGAPMEARSEDGYTPLSFALERISRTPLTDGGKEMIDYLLSIGCRTDVLDNKNRSVLMTSHCELPTEYTVKLLKAGVRVDLFDRDAQIHGITRLVKTVMLSRESKCLENLELIVRTKPNLNPTVSKIEDSPLGAAISFAGAIDQEFFAPLDIASLLLAHGADPAIRSEDGETVLFCANSREAIAWVLGRDPHFLDDRNLRGQTPLLALTRKACMLQNGGRAGTAAIMALIAAGADLDAVDDQGPVMCKTPRIMIRASNKPDLKDLKNFLSAHEASTQARAALHEIEPKRPLP